MKVNSASACLKLFRGLQLRRFFGALPLTDLERLRFEDELELELGLVLEFDELELELNSPDSFFLSQLMSDLPTP